MNYSCKLHKFYKTSRPLPNRFKVNVNLGPTDKAKVLTTFFSPQLILLRGPTVYFNFSRGKLLILKETYSTCDFPWGVQTLMHPFLDPCMYQPYKCFCCSFDKNIQEGCTQNPSTHVDRLAPLLKQFSSKCHIIYL